MSYQLIHGDCLAVMAGMDAASIDAVVCDPPYGLEFMGKSWDKLDGGGGKASARAMQEWHEAWAVEALRVLKPSHYLLAFGGTRTWHRLACAIEDAGFEIRDTLCWLHGQGFPKGKACLKPAWEPIILARKPGPMRELGIEECRIPIEGVIDPRRHGYNGPGAGLGNGEVYGGGWRNEYSGATVPHPDSPRHHATGRWPANVILDEAAAGLVDEQTGNRLGYATQRHLTDASDKSVFGVSASPDRESVAFNDSGGASRFFKTVPGPSPCGDHVPCGECINREDCDYASDYACPVPGCHGSGMHFCPEDEGGDCGKHQAVSAGDRCDCGGRTQGTAQASEDGIPRFRYVAKASRRERNAGLEGMPERYTARDNGYSDKLSDTKLPRANHHPTVKPLTLMRWLVRLVARPGDVVLDPFTGSGTTGVACAKEGRDFIGIELDAEYVEIARRRIEAAAAQERLPV